MLVLFGVPAFRQQLRFIRACAQGFQYDCWYLKAHGRTACKAPAPRPSKLSIKHEELRVELPCGQQQQRRPCGARLLLALPRLLFPASHLLQGRSHPVRTGEGGCRAIAKRRSALPRRCRRAARAPPLGARGARREPLACLADAQIAHKTRQPATRLPWAPGFLLRPPTRLVPTINRAGALQHARLRCAPTCLFPLPPFAFHLSPRAALQTAAQSGRSGGPRASRPPPCTFTSASSSSSTCRATRRGAEGLLR